MIVDRYYYHQLNKQEQAIYKAFYKGVMSHQEIIPIPVRGEFSQESFERIFMAMTRDNPLIYFLNQSACSTASDMFEHIAICPQYFFTKEKVKEYNRKIEKVVNELAGQLHLLECNDYEKELRVHNWICRNIEYDYEGADKDKVSRVIASHNILGVFAHHKAQCKGPEDLEEQCQKRGLLIRDCSNYRGLSKGYFRIAVRTREENDQLIKIFQDIIREKQKESGAIYGWRK